MFNNTSGFVIHNSQFIDNSQNVNLRADTTGIDICFEKLLQASIPEAAHDSSARWPPPQCFPGTREQHIQEFVKWASSAAATVQVRRFRIMWTNGPAGVGKSALAQTCAEKIGKLGDLGAAFFFSEPNKRADADRFIPSIAYQLSTKFKPLANILDQKIREDPSLLSKDIEVQFKELILEPFLELRARGEKIRERLVIVDGLDECDSDDAQCAIIELVAAAVREHGDCFPLLWAFFSRPEPHIVQTFSSDIISPICRVAILPVSRDIDEEIELYLRARFEDIQKRRKVATSSSGTWPSDECILTLVDMSAGLFVYAATVLKFVGDPDAMDPEEQLQAVLSLRTGNPLPSNIQQSPTEELDALYTLIMKRIPAKILLFTQRILLLFNQAPKIRATYRGHVENNLGQIIPVLCNIMGVTFTSFEAALSRLHSVLTIDQAPESVHQKPGTSIPWRIRFHHASFMEFLVNQKRAGEIFWIRHPRHYEFLATRGITIVNEMLEAPGSSLKLQTSSVTLSAPLANIDKESTLAIRSVLCDHVSGKVFDWFASASLELGGELLLRLVLFDFRSYWTIRKSRVLSRGTLDMLFAKVPLEHRDQIIRQYKPRRLTLKWLKDRHARNGPKLETGYVLGQGEKSIKVEFSKDGQISINQGA
ncbi:hypothetical protein P691DRAFT_709325 [Macrolepiota fuliginosa MF-IS2]|uniref:Nephrocystin 3-like N-terminal domain-containing protein n=1 Tax=Macrolepiota fuliginosa MF-IS2 TaxID=1400762 RepID=A0A9P5X9X6_9AGAR|nr:hypothetical protein P691DRAFT_709325 [Macrolepiota fuliginosa MF-IS2]